MFLIKLWLLVSEEEESVQGLDVAEQGVLGFSQSLLAAATCACHKGWFSRADCV